MHCVIAQRIAANPALLGFARETIARWRKTCTAATPYLDAWDRALESGVDATVKIATDPSERGIAMRQNTPFTRVLTQAERLQFFKRWKAENEKK